jgi:hypothetical protein
VHGGRGRGHGRQWELDVGGCEDLTAAPHSGVDDDATDVRKWKGNAAAVGVELFESDTHFMVEDAIWGMGL